MARNPHPPRIGGPRQSAKGRGGRGELASLEPFSGGLGTSEGSLGPGAAPFCATLYYLGRAPMPRPSRFLALAQTIDAERAAACSSRLAPALHRSSTAYALATLLSAAYPALGSVLEGSPDIARRLADEGFVTARSHADFLARTLARVGDLGDAERVARELRRAAPDERIRIALRELLPPSLGGADVDVTSRELADLAAATIEVALAEAVHSVSQRFGVPRTAAGAPRPLHGARHGQARRRRARRRLGRQSRLLLRHRRRRGAARLRRRRSRSTTTGPGWRSGSRPTSRSPPRTASSGASICASARRGAAGRWSTPWRRPNATTSRSAASGSGRRSCAPGPSPGIGRSATRCWPRSRPSSGAGASTRGSPARWSGWRGNRGRSSPPTPRAISSWVRVASARLSSSCSPSSSSGAARSRGSAPRTRWTGCAGCAPRGSSPTARRAGSPRPTWRSAGPSTPCRSPPACRRTPAPRTPPPRAAWRAPWASTGPRRSTPTSPATCPGWRRASSPSSRRGRPRVALLVRHRGPGARQSRGLRRRRPPRRQRGGGSARRNRSSGRIAGPIWRAISSSSPATPTRRSAAAPASSTRRWRRMLEAVVDAADPEQAARYLRTFFARVKRPGVYIKLLGDNPRAVRRLVEALGASAFIGDALANNPELGDVVLFARGAPAPDLARAEVAVALRESRAAEADDDEAVVEALRRAKARVTLEVGLARSRQPARHARGHPHALGARRRRARGRRPPRARHPRGRDGPRRPRHGQARRGARSATDRTSTSSSSSIRPQAPRGHRPDTRTSPAPGAASSGSSASRTGRARATSSTPGSVRRATRGCW